MATSCTISSREQVPSCRSTARITEPLLPWVRRFSPCSDLRAQRRLFCESGVYSARSVTKAGRLGVSEVLRSFEWNGCMRENFSPVGAGSHGQADLQTSLPHPLSPINRFMLRSLTEQLAKPGSLSNEQVGLAVVELINESVLAELKADFLTALARKGETSDEIAAFARELRA